VMDSMPRQLMVSVVRSAQPKEKFMSTTQGQGGAAPAATTTNAVRSEGTPAAAPAATPAVDESVTIKRSELSQLIADGIAAHEASKKAELERAAAEEKAKAEQITRSDATALVEAATKPLLAEIEALKGTTVVRSAGTDPAVKAPVGEKQDVFRGAFGSLPFGGRKKAQA
jgi:hypothetical protein